MIAALLLAAAVQGQVPPELARVRAQVSVLEQRLIGLEQRQGDLSRERQRLEAERELAELKVRESETELQSIDRARAASTAEARSAESELAVAVERLKSQLTLLALLGREGLSPLVLRAAGGDDAPQRITVALAMVREQKQRRDELAGLVERRAAALAELSRRSEQAREVAATLVTRRAELDRTRSRVVAELTRLEHERRSGAAELVEARDSEGRLERLLGVVAGDDGGSRLDVRLLRGGLPWPSAKGSVVRRFGPQRDQRYGTVTVSHGLTLALPRGESVRAIAEGKVAYAQFFKGYGNLVIVQHGAQLYSLYAQLASMLVRAGQRVRMGEPVGMAGPDGGEGNFYLELRVAQQAQDPLLWLKPAER